LADFRSIDPVLNHWAAKNRIQVFTEYRESDVRTFDLLSSSGITFQVWLDVPATDGSVTIHAWDFSDRRWSRSGQTVNLPVLLDEALAVVNTWMAPS
jgi:hypothetical protein